MFKLNIKDLNQLFDQLQAGGFDVFGPKVKQEAISLSKLDHFSELPVGYRDSQSAGSYRVVKTEEPTYFGYAVGPHSIKNILHPAKRKLFDAHREANGALHIHSVTPLETKLSLFGIRSCDLAALKILDKVFLESGHVDRHYQSLRQNLLTITASCNNPSSVCFCTSMGHGPKATAMDIHITEIWNPEHHYFIAESGSPKGLSLLKALDLPKASKRERQEAEDRLEQSISKINKTLDTKDLPPFLAKNVNHPHWEDVAERCLSCGNCTMVCPTCFCTSTFDKNDLEGDHSERWQQWDSCFTSDFSYIHGGTVRGSTKSRYRQWLTHKLSSWHEQFGTSGCVGCGRCIVWCPVGIDLTKEVQALRQVPAEKAHSLEEKEPS